MLPAASELENLSVHHRPALVLSHCEPVGRKPTTALTKPDDDFYRTGLAATHQLSKPIAVCNRRSDVLRQRFFQKGKHVEQRRFARSVGTYHNGHTRQALHHCMAEEPVVLDFDAFDLHSSVPDPVDI